MSNDRHELPEGTRDSVIERYVMQALSAGVMTREGYADDVRKIYWQIVPEKQRKVRFADPDSHPKPSTVLASNAKTVFRFWDDSVSARMPVAIEEAMAYALPDPYGEDCRYALVYRLGYWGVKRHEPNGRGDYKAWGQALRGFGDVNVDMAEILADMVIDENDRPHIPRAIADIDAEVAHLLSVRQQLKRVQEGKGEEEKPQLRRVV